MSEKQPVHIEHVFQPVITIRTDGDGSNPRFSGIDWMDSHTQSVPVYGSGDGDTVADLDGAMFTGGVTDPRVQAICEWMDERYEFLSELVTVALRCRSGRFSVDDMGDIIIDGPYDSATHRHYGSTDAKVPVPAGMPKRVDIYGPDSTDLDDPELWEQIVALTHTRQPS